jgi:hypothetical protein
LKLAV